MDQLAALPKYSAPSCQLKGGFRSLAEEAQMRHPIDIMQCSSKDSIRMSKLESARKMYGKHMAIALAAEQALFGDQVPSLSTNTILLDIANGQESTITFDELYGGTCTQWMLLLFLILYVRRTKIEARNPKSDATRYDGSKVWTYVMHLLCFTNNNDFFCKEVNVCHEKGTQLTEMN